MTITLNGATYETAATTVAALLEELKAPEQGTAVAVNDQVVRRALHNTTTLHAGDRVELVRAVQGG